MNILRPPSRPEDDGEQEQAIHKPLPENDPKVRQPDISKARRLLGWSRRSAPSGGFRSASSTSARPFRPGKRGAELTGGRSRPDAARAILKEKVWGGDRLARYPAKGVGPGSRIANRGRRAAPARPRAREPLLRRTGGTRVSEPASAVASHDSPIRLRARRPSLE